MNARILLAGLAVFALAAAAIVLLSPVLAVVAGFGGLLLIAYRFAVDSDPPKV